MNLVNYMQSFDFDIPYGLLIPVLCDILFSLVQHFDLIDIEFCLSIVLYTLACFLCFTLIIVNQLQNEIEMQRTDDTIEWYIECYNVDPATMALNWFAEQISWFVFVIVVLTWQLVKTSNFIPLFCAKIKKLFYATMTGIINLSERLF